MARIVKRLFVDFNWVPLEGVWDAKGGGLCFTGNEYEAPPAESTPNMTRTEKDEAPRAKLVGAGIAIFGQKFQEGRIGFDIEFKDADYRSSAGIILQYDTETRDMLVFSVSGGGLKPAPGVSGSLFKLQSWASSSDQRRQQRGNSSDLPKRWSSLFEVGLGTNIKGKRPYRLEAEVRGAAIILHGDGVEIGRHNLPEPSLAGLSCGAFSLSHNEIMFTNIIVETSSPKAFVAMQFQTPEYEAIFREVIEPVCASQGLQAYRADFTYMPGLIIEDIKKQILEARVVIAEITPQNPNVYYEVGYADALNKPVILISDRKEGLKPFDVRAYRTIFYDNSIGGRSKIETELRSYLQTIMEN